MKIQTPLSLLWQRSLHFKGWESGNCTGGGCSWKTHMGNPWSALPVLRMSYRASHSGKTLKDTFTNTVTHSVE